MKMMYDVYDFRGNFYTTVFGEIESERIAAQIGGFCKESTEYNSTNRTQQHQNREARKSLRSR